MAMACKDTLAPYILHFNIVAYVKLNGTKIVL